MKKLILALILASLLNLNGLYAQCTPNASLTQPGYYPNCLQGLPHDTVGVAYSTVLQLRVLTDTTVSSIPATVDSVVLTSVKGMPSGFNYATNPASKSFPGGSNACVLVTGAAPTAGMAGSYPLVIYITVYGKIGGSIPASLPDSVTCYSIQIDPAATGIPEFSNNKFSMSQNFPDPAVGQTTIYYNVPASTPVNFKVYNLLGKIVYEKSFFTERGQSKISLDARDFAPGIYMYNLSDGKTTLTKRMVMANN